MFLKLKLIWLFYQKYLLASFLMSVLCYVLGFLLVSTIFFKLIAISLGIFLPNIKGSKSGFTFYQNLGLSIRYLLGAVFLIDITISISLFKIPPLLLTIL